MTVLRILFLLAFGRRPMTLPEVAEFAILEEGTTEISSDNRFEDFTDILSLCGSFVVIQDEHILLAHKSIRDFLIAQATGDDTETATREIHAFIEERCLAYLSMANLSTVAVTDRQDPDNEKPIFMQRWEATQLQYPLADYACTMWSHHTEAAGMTEKLRSYAFFSINRAENRPSL
jgi:hypothetical protein